MSKKINKVRVLVDFPGYKKGDVLELDSKAGVFHFTNVTMEDGSVGDAFDVFAARITGEIKPSITKKEVELYLGTLFEDISIYKVRSYREFQIRIDEIKSFLKRLEDPDTLVGVNLNRKEAITVLQNILWEYEWIMGGCEMYGINIEKTTTDEKPYIDEDYSDRIPTEYDPGDFIDGNELERQQNESSNTDEVREDS